MAEILNSRPLSLSEVAELVKKHEGFENKLTASYLKAFSKVKFQEAKEIEKKIKALDNVKIKESHIVKVLDMMPQDSEDVNKIFLDSSLSEEEIQAILKIVKEK